jgi:uncharacterized membrane protein (UPF0127 family)
MMWLRRLGLCRIVAAGALMTELALTPRCLLSGLAVASLLCCARPPQPAPAPEVAPAPAPAAAAAEPVAWGEVEVRPGLVLRVELARTEPERQRGLMFRQSLAGGHGMLFFMPGDDDWAFYMRNTYIPLDMVFIDRDWSVVGVLEAVPPLTEDLRTVGVPSRHVLELGAHEAGRAGIRPGVRLRFREEPGP